MGETEKETEKFYKSTNFKVLSCLVILLFALMALPSQVYALGEGEYVEFGSDEYQWWFDEVSPIGVYVNAPEGETIDSVKLTVHYNENIIENETGDVTATENVITIEEYNIDAEEYRKTLRFKPLVGGRTIIAVAEAVIICGENVYTEKNVRSGNIYLGNPEESGMQGITINGERLPIFSAKEVEYVYTLETNSEEVIVKTQPSSLDAEIVIANKAGTFKQVTIYVTNGIGTKYRYEIDVHKENVYQAEAIVEEGTLPAEKSEPEILMQGDPKNNSRNKNMTTIVIVELIAIFAILLLIRVRMSYRKKQLAKYNRGKGRRGKERADKLYAAWANNKEIEIVVDHVTMKFKLEREEASSLKEALIRRIKGQVNNENFKALDNVSFTVNKGEVLGIIGTNGSGKSTLLKIVSGALTPTKGTVLVDRSRVQLLTLGTGFDNELTGKENVYLNGSLNGYSKEFIDEKYEDIVTFAELEGFMEERVKNYSSGMVSRLAFAIATIRETPEILILDEVLGVGDMFFRKKSNARIKEMMNSGSTVLIVSHSPATIAENCTKAVWIERGKLRAFGEPKNVCKQYINMDKEQK